MSSSRAADAANPIDAAPLHYLAHLLWEVSTRTELIAEAALAGTPLSLAASGLLQGIGASPGCTIADLARQVPKSQQAISQLVARLEKVGYVERRLGTGRGVQLYLTDAGVAARDQGADAEAQIEDLLRERLGGDRYERLRGLLEEARERMIEP